MAWDIIIVRLLGGIQASLHYLQFSHLADASIATLFRLVIQTFNDTVQGGSNPTTSKLCTQLPNHYAAL